jgi:O-antigen/teichoic acid export membrane protein
MFDQIKLLAKHSAVYGAGGIASRVIAVLLLPLYTRYLSPADYGALETLLALSVVLTILLRLGITNAFFRFYFDSPADEHRLRVIRTSFWFTMGTATLGLVAGVALAGPISSAFFGTSDHADLVRAAFVGIWAQVNYEQLTSLFRVEQRSMAFVVATLANLLVTIAVTIVLVVVADLGALGVIVGNFTGTLVVWAGLLGYRREQLGLQFDRPLLREMNRFGLPFVPTALGLWVTNFSDRFFLVKLASVEETGLYSVGVRVASVLVLLLTAFRTAFPAFAYSIQDDSEARRTYGYVFTYLTFICAWLSLALGVLAPWIVELLTTPTYQPGERVVALLAFALTFFAGYIVMTVSIGRARRTQFNWVATGMAAAVNVALNLILIPPYGIIGAAIATLAAYATMFAAMAWRAQRIFPIEAQWRRLATAVGAAAALTIVGRVLDVPLAGAILLVLAYPFLLLPLGFYLPEELHRLRAMGRARRTERPQSHAEGAAVAIQEDPSVARRLDGVDDAHP